MTGTQTQGTRHGVGTLLMDLMMVGLALISIAIIIYDEVANPTGRVHEALIQLDLLIVFVFAVEFAYRFWKAPDRRRFFARNWWELPGMVPLAVGELALFRTFRLLRVIVILRVLRVVGIIARLQRLNRLMMRFMERSHLPWVFTITSSLILGGAFVVWMVERDANQAFLTFADALWWTVVTITTVGYGDVVPITNAGKGVATVLMFMGVGLIGVMSSTLAHTFLRGDIEEAMEEASDDRELRESSLESGLVWQLDTLSRLQSSGALTLDEFERAKARVLEV